MNSTPPKDLTASQVQALQRLAEAPATREAFERFEADRAARRVSILTDMTAVEGRAVGVASRLGREVEIKEAQVARLRQQLLAAELELHQVAAAWGDAGSVAQRARAVAQRALSQLGGESIEVALAAVRTAEANARAEASVYVDERRDVGNWLNPRQETLPVPANPEAVKRHARLTELAAELERMRFAPLAPREIEARCAEIQAEASGTPPPAARESGCWYVSPTR